MVDRATPGAPPGAAASVPACVLAAFGARGEPVRLDGGMGRSVRVGECVLKPVDDAVEAAWCAEVLERIGAAGAGAGGGGGFRIARPVRAGDGRFVVDGWTAAAVVAGTTGPDGRWAALLDAGRAFHRALRDVERPAFLDRRTHRWALADRVAWGEADLRPLPAVAPVLDALLALRRPVRAPAQVVHGDLAGNVLFAPGQPPAVIDFSPYWRPVAFADAVIAADGMLWSGAGPELSRLAARGSGAAFPQVLVRALIFRLVALNERARDVDPGCVAEVDLFGPVVAHARHLVNGRPSG